MKKRLLYLLPIIALGLFGAIAWIGLSPNRDPSALPSALIGKPVPSFNLTTLDPSSGGLTPQDFAGRVTVVNFFASWCVPCRAEHPLLTRITRDLGVPIFGIAWNDKPDATRAYLQELGNPYARIGVDESGRTGIDFGITGVPESFVVGRDGRICSRQWGPVTDEAAEKSVADQVKACRG